MDVRDFDFDLPTELIAQEPASNGARRGCSSSIAILNQSRIPASCAAGPAARG